MGLSEKMFRQLSVSSGKTFPGITKAAGKLQSPRPYLHFSLILFYKRLYFLVDALGIQSILLNQFQRRTGLSEHIVDTDLHDFRRLLLGKDVAYGASQSADHGMLLDRYHFSGLCYRRQHQLFIQRLDRMDVDNLRVNTVCCQKLLRLSRLVHTQSCCKYRDIFSLF